MRVVFYTDKMEPTQLASGDLPSVPRYNEWVMIRKAGEAKPTPYKVTSVEWHITRHTQSPDGGEIQAGVYLSEVK